MMILAVFIYFVEIDNQCAGERLGDTSLQCPEVFDSVWAYRYDTASKNEWWRFITYMLLHAGAAHVTANLFLQIIVGIPLEMVHGPRSGMLTTIFIVTITILVFATIIIITITILIILLLLLLLLRIIIINHSVMIGGRNTHLFIRNRRIFILYVLGGLAGSFSVSVFDKNTNIVGASAGCYALVGAHVANIINYWSIMPFPLIRLLVFSLIFSVDVVLSAYRRYAENDTSVSFSSHLAGALLGLTLGGVVLNGLDQGKNSGDNDERDDHHPSSSSICRLVCI